MQNKTLVIDLDGTIAMLPKDSRDFLNATLNKPVLAKLAQLKGQGYRLILDTARGDKRRGKEDFCTVADAVEAEVIGWLRANGLEYFFDQIRIGSKRYADLYVDDKGIPPEAIVAGFTTYAEWLSFCQSAYFATAMANFKTGSNQIHLPLC